jgi:hypothetical protein
MPGQDGHGVVGIVAFGGSLSTMTLGMGFDEEKECRNVGNIGSIG